MAEARRLASAAWIIAVVIMLTSAARPAAGAPGGATPAVFLSCYTSSDRPLEVRCAASASSPVGASDSRGVFTWTASAGTPSSAISTSTGTQVDFSTTLSAPGSTTVTVQVCYGSACSSAAVTVTFTGPTVEQRIAQFWQRVNALAPSDNITASDLGQWARNVIDRDPGAGIIVRDFRASTAAMQAAFDRAPVGPPPSDRPDVEARIALFWQRVDALAPTDKLTAADLGQWGLNVTDRDPGARIRVDDFRTATAAMQAAFDRAGFSVTPTPSPTPAPVLGGTISTYAGTGTMGFSGDGGAATAAQLNYPRGVAVDAAGNLYISDVLNQRIRKVTPGGTITTYAGTGTKGFSGDGGPATGAQLNYPAALAVDAAGNLYIAELDRIRRVTRGGTISTYAGGGVYNGDGGGDGGPATAASFSSAAGVALDSAGNLYFAERLQQRVRKVTPGGIISTYAGTGTKGFSGDGGPATAAQLNIPAALAVDAAGNLYIAELDRIRRVTRGGTISTYAGGGAAYPGDGGSAIAAHLNYPTDIAVDAAGNLYIADTALYAYSGGGGGNPLITDARRIRKVTPGGSISTYAGGGAVFPGDEGVASQEQIPAFGIALDAAGNLYISGNHRIRRIAP